MNNKYIGCLIGAAAGDALGAPTETRNPQRIVSHFNGPVRTFLAPPNDVFARGNRPAQVTDDFSLAYVTLLTVLETNSVSQEIAIQSLVNWANPQYNYLHLAGPTTQATIRRLQGEQVSSSDFVIASDNAKATNGLAMKIAPIALLSHGDIQKALDITVTIGMVSHHNQIAIAAGCAVAAATAQALRESSTLDDVLQAALQGAFEGEQRAIKLGADILAGSSVHRRIQHALAIARSAKSKLTGTQELIDLIGTGILAYESIPTAFGLLLLYQDEPLEAVFAAVNIGNDTDTIATIVGGILGAFHGADIFPEDYLPMLDEANEYDLVKLASRIESWQR